MLDLGPQPICSHFQADMRKSGNWHPLALARCLRCGQLQVQDPAPVSLLRSPHPWISYIEPEGHLDTLVDELCRLPGAGPQWRVAGVSYKDASTIERLQRRGWTKHWLLDPFEDLDIPDGVADLATIQEQLTPERAKNAAARHGKCDILIVRHILEHTQFPGNFLNALKELVETEGIVVFECPDSRQAFLNREYTVLWEEHLWYFTPQLFSRFFQQLGMRLERLIVYPYPIENSLVAVVKPHVKAEESEAVSPTLLSDERRQMESYGGEYPERKRAWLKWIETEGGRLAAFGAGHSMVAFINFFELGNLIEFVADDHPKKQGLFLPGSNVPIRPSILLQERGIDHCLMGLSPESEAKVLARQRQAQENGVRFVSIFPMSAFAVFLVRPERSSTRDVLKMDSSLPMHEDEAPKKLRGLASTSLRKRVRFSAHAAPSETLHEMLICLHESGYVRPHRHNARPESIHVVEGYADLILFSDTGGIERIVALGPYGSGLCWFVRLQQPVFHTLLLRGEDFIFMETTLGPFLKEATEMASWAPEENDVAAIQAYKCNLTGEVLTRGSRREN